MDPNYVNMIGAVADPVDVVADDTDIQMDEATGATPRPAPSAPVQCPLGSGGRGR